VTNTNVIFILIDDLGWRDLGCYGSTFYETPNLDRLASEGVRFTDAYAACPVCSPSRASVMTGRYPARVGVTNFIGGHTKGRLLEAPYIDHLPAEECSLASALKRADYHAWHVGKWHLGGREFWPDRHGFDVNIGGCEWGMPKHGYFSPYGNPTLPDGPDGEYLTDRLTDEAIRLIRGADGQPFFLYLSYYAVHIPIQVKADVEARFRQKAHDLGLDRERAFAEGEVFPCEHKKDQRVVRRLLQSDAAYAAMVYTLDENIGRLLAALDEAGLSDTTAIFFTSDNGGLATAEGSPTCNAPLSEGKGWMYEGGTREPLIVRCPGVAGGDVSRAVVSSPDFYPTILDMCGLDPLPEQHVDGVSFLPALSGGGEIDRDAVYWHYPHYGNQGGAPASSLRAGDHKLIEFFEDGRLELYNLADDISEDHDLAGDLPDLTADLHGLLVRWRETVGARLPKPNPDY